MEDGWTAQNIAIYNDGERMIVTNHWSYWAHLSIYHFAIQFTSGRRVLDAGSGAGYGAAYLARHGAAGVLAFDAGADAVAHSRQRYAGDAVTYEVADLNKPLPIGDRLFDLVFSSNVFEHVANVDGLASECARVIKEDGVVVVAVPPVASVETLIGDIRNHFHVNHLPPSAWYAKLSRFFMDVQCHGHWHLGEFKSPERQQQEINALPDKVMIRETDFEFPETTPGALDREPIITAVYVCRRPRAAPLPETLAERTPGAWHESAVAAQVVSEERAGAAKLREELAAAHADITALRSRLEAAGLQPRTPEALNEASSADVYELRARLAAIERSTSWRITAPLRAVKRLLAG